MKKYIFIPIIAFFLAFNVSYGATLTREDLLRQLISLLIQQVQLLTEQLNAVQLQQKTVQISTTTPQVFGSAPVVEIPVQNAIITQANNTLTQLNNMQLDVIEENSFKWNTTDTTDGSTQTAIVKRFFVFLDDASGQPTSGSITMSNTSTAPASFIPRDEATQVTKLIGVPGRRQGQGVMFSPKFWANGNYTVTFTSGDTTKSVDISINEL